MYDIELQQIVFKTVVNLCEKEGEAYIASIVASINEQTKQTERGLQNLNDRVRRMLKKLTDADVLSEHEGELSRNRVQKLYYKQKNEYIMFGANNNNEGEDKKSGGFVMMALKQFIMICGGAKGVAKHVLNMISNNEGKIAGFIEAREEKMREGNELRTQEKLNFSFTQVKGKILIMENAMYTHDKDIRVRIINKYNLIEFSDLIKTIIEKNEKENGDTQGIGENNG